MLYLILVATLWGRYNYYHHPHCFWIWKLGHRVSNLLYIANRWGSWDHFQRLNANFWCFSPYATLSLEMKICVPEVTWHYLCAGKILWFINLERSLVCWRTARPLCVVSVFPHVRPLEHFIWPWGLGSRGIMGILHIPKPWVSSNAQGPALLPYSPII